MAHQCIRAMLNSLEASDTLTIYTLFFFFIEELSLALHEESSETQYSLVEVMPSLYLVFILFFS